MTRIETLCSLLERADTFADVGCDHGYCAAYMLTNGLCREAVISDVSRASLAKAERLLAARIEEGSCRANCADGLTGIAEDTSLVLIAGMGGMEIIGILERGFLPKRFVFQPMKNTEALRRYLVGRGAKIERDFTFYDGKYYDAIKGSRAGGSSYTEAEFRFGRDNLRERPADFLRYLRHRIEREKEIASGLPEPLKGEREALVKAMQEVVS